MNRSHSRSLVFACAISVGLCGAVTPTIVWAQPQNRDRDRAVAAYEAQDYATALSLFQRVYIDSRDPAILFNIGRTQERLNRPADAARAYRLFLDSVPSAPNRQEIETQIANLERQAAAQQPVQTPPNPNPNQTTNNGTNPTQPPTNTVVVLGPRPAWPWVITGTGIVSLGVGATLMALVPQAFANASQAPTETQYNNLVNSTYAQQTAGGVLLGVGAALSVAGVILYFTLPRPQQTIQVPNANSTRFGVTPLLGGAAGTLSWQWF